jgi:hypothetical protein
VEHHFKPYGSASSNLVVLLSAASQRAPHVRLVTGAVVPAFNHPLKYAGELAMLDCISGGRLDAGFARAFRPGCIRPRISCSARVSARMRACAWAIAAPVPDGSCPAYDGPVSSGRTSRRPASGRRLS